MIDRAYGGLLVFMIAFPVDFTDESLRLGHKKRAFAPPDKFVSVTNICNAVPISYGVENTCILGTQALSQ